MHIEKANYDDFLFYRGYCEKDSPLSHDIQEEKVQYYLIYDEKTILDDIWVYKNPDYPNYCDLGRDPEMMASYFSDLLDKLFLDYEKILVTFSKENDYTLFIEHGFRILNEKEEVVILVKDLPSTVK